MKLVIDVMGFDHSPNEAIKACREFQKANPDVEFIIVGIEKEIKQFIHQSDNFAIVNADQVVHTEESFLTTLRNTETSMHKALTMVANGEADGVLSAGSSAAYVVLSTMIIKAINGVSKPAFMAHVPTVNKKGMMLLDVGANINCDANDLVTFAKMADIYCKNIRHVVNPTVFVLNNGTEKNKGYPHHQEADKILSASTSINYKGFIEGKYILSGNADVIVSDGYTGNAALKSMEGALKYMKDEIKIQYKKP
jgi:glycerol-3-phosphate acyltransferase PlsX